MKPKYAEVYEHLLQRIAHLNPGDKLDSELTLAKEMNVAPMTVRRALQLLSDEGKTIGIPGKGTFLAQQAHARNVLSASFSEENFNDHLLDYLLAQQHPFTRTHQWITHATEQDTHNFSISPSSSLYHLEFTHHTQEEVVAHSLSRINGTLCPDFLSCSTSLSNTAIFRLNYSRTITDVTIRFELRPPSEQAQQALDISGDSYSPLVTAHFTDSHGNLLEIRTITHHPKHFSFTAHINPSK